MPLTQRSEVVTMFPRGSWESTPSGFGSRAGPKSTLAVAGSADRGSVPSDFCQPWATGPVPSWSGRTGQGARHHDLTVEGLVDGAHVGDLLQTAEFAFVEVTFDVDLPIDVVDKPAR